MVAAAADRVLLISWTLSGGGPLWKPLRRGTLAADMLQWLRGEYGYRSPPAWSISLQVELPETLPPPWYEQEIDSRRLFAGDSPVADESGRAAGVRLVSGRAAPRRHARGRRRPGGQLCPRRRALRGRRAGRRFAKRGGANMRIVNVDVDGYGVWSGLKIERLSEALNVFHGPNEAGKTTLLQFIRSVLYGFSPDRQRYLPPAHGGRAGGALDVLSPHGPFQISRHSAEGDADGGTGLASGTRPGDDWPASRRRTTRLTAPDGTRQGEHFVKVLLSNVDEATFNNVFAVGLREVQELATLSDTAAAELLYNLTVGLDRVSLVEVLHELEASRNRVLDALGRPCQVTELLAEREKLRSEIEDLGSINHRYGQLAAERGRLQAEIDRLEEEANRARHLAELMDLAVAVHDLWGQRAAIDEQLSSLAPVAAMPPRAIERLDAVAGRMQKHQHRIDGFVEAARRAAERIRRAADRRRPGAPGGPHRGPPRARAVDHSVAGGDRRIGEGRQPASVRVGRRSEAPWARGLSQFSCQRKWDCPLWAAGLGREAARAPLARQARCAKPADASAEAKTAAAAAATTAESLAEQIHSAVGRQRRPGLDRRVGSGGQSRQPTPPPRADRRADGGIGPTSRGIGRAGTPVGPARTAADERIGRPRRGVRRRRRAAAIRRTDAGVDRRHGRLDPGRPGFGWHRRRRGREGDARTLERRPACGLREAAGVDSLPDSASRGGSRRAGRPLARRRRGWRAGCRRPKKTWRPWKGWRRWMRGASRPGKRPKPLGTAPKRHCEG